MNMKEPVKAPAGFGWTVPSGRISSNGAVAAIFVTGRVKSNSASFVRANSRRRESASSVYLEPRRNESR